MKRAAYRVGAATADLTPELSGKVYLAGFAPNRTATGIAHPLQVGAIYLEDHTKEPVCFVTLDLIGLLQPDVEAIRDRVADLVPRAAVLICCTHTHSGPDTLGLWGPTALGIPFRSGCDETYRMGVIETTARVITEAVQKARPSTLRSFSFTIPPGWVRNERRGGGFYRQASGLVVHRDGEPYAACLNFAAHPEALWEKNRLVSPDYPAPFRKHMKDMGIRYPLFFSGPLGAMLTPDIALEAPVDERLKYIRFFGRRLAQKTQQAITRATPLSGPIRVREAVVTLPNANPRYALARRLGYIQRPLHQGRITTRIALGRLGPLWFTTVPGEPSPEVGHQIAAALDGEVNLIFALGLDELGYIIPAEFFQNREYKYEQTMSAGAHVASQVLATIGALRKQVEHDD